MKKESLPPNVINTDRLIPICIHRAPNNPKTERGRAPRAFEKHHSLRFDQTMPRDLTAPAHDTASGTGALERLLVLRADFRVEILLRFWIGSTIFGGLPGAHVTLPCIVDLNRNSLLIIFGGCTFTIGTTFVNLTPTNCSGALQTVHGESPPGRY